MTEIQADVKQIIKLFCCLNGRDEFIEVYARLLSERLLNKLSISDEAEESLIKLLQVECGLSAVSKIKTMFSDVSKSSSLLKEFRTDKGNAVEGIEFHPQILSAGQWPFEASHSIKLPKPMSAIDQVFQQFYDSKFKNRELIWQYDRGSVIL